MPGIAQKNNTVQPHKPSTAEQMHQLDMVQEYIEKVEGIAIFLEICGGEGQKFIELINWLGMHGLATAMEEAYFHMLFDVARGVIGALSMDPPRMDYTLLATAHPAPLPPVEFSPDVPASLGAAFCETMTVGGRMVAELRAAAVSGERLSGAATHGDTAWMAQQAAALSAFKTAAGQTMVNFAAILRSVIDELASAGFTQMRVNRDTFVADQERLREKGFTDGEIAALRELGATDGEIADSLQSRISRDPATLPDDPRAALLEAADACQRLGSVLAGAGTAPPVAAARHDIPQFDLRASSEPPAPCQLAPLGEAHMTIPVRNPLGERRVVRLRIRRVDIPASWDVKVIPDQLDLDAGESSTVAIAVTADTPGIQGSLPRLAVEGDVDGDLIGGVVLDIAVPRAAVASFTMDPARPLAGEKVTIHSTSASPDGPVHGHLWCIDDDFDHAHGPDATKIFDKPGEHHIRLTVLDEANLTWTAEQDFTVAPVEK